METRVSEGFGKDGLSELLLHNPREERGRCRIRVSLASEPNDDAETRGE